jgi:hypothetical protein
MSFPDKMQGQMWLVWALTLKKIILGSRIFKYSMKIQRFISCSLQIKTEKILINH